MVSQRAKAQLGYWPAGQSGRLGGTCEDCRRGRCGRTRIMPPLDVAEARWHRQTDVLRNGTVFQDAALLVAFSESKVLASLTKAETNCEQPQFSLSGDWQSCRFRYANDWCVWWSDVEVGLLPRESESVAPRKARATDASLVAWPHAGLEADRYAPNRGIRDPRRAWVRPR